MKKYQLDNLCSLGQWTQNGFAYVVISYMNVNIVIYAICLRN